MQPEWRKTDYTSRGKLWQAPGSSFDELIIPGANGIISVIGCLCWWKTALDESGLDDDADGAVPKWADALTNVSWVVVELSKISSKKR